MSALRHNALVIYHRGGLSRGASLMRARRALHTVVPGSVAANLTNETRLALLVSEIRSRGHLIAALNPVSEFQSLAPCGAMHCHLPSDAEFADEKQLGTVKVSAAAARALAQQTPDLANEHNAELPAKNIIEHLKNVYCGPISFEFMHLDVAQEREWFQQTVEKEVAALARTMAAPVAPQAKDLLRRVYFNLTASTLLDEFIGKRFPTTKRYGLEGAEPMLVAVNGILEAHCGRQSSADHNHLVIGMPHRGRLNLLALVMLVPLRTVFAKLRGLPELDPQRYSCDVLSHLAGRAWYPAQSPLSQLSVSQQENKKTRIVLLHNPSHLETASPVACGSARALGKSALCLQVHGDAAVAAQGVSAETGVLSGLPQYSVGGSIHLVVNNQLGFTTPSALGFSSRHCTGALAGASGAPVIHVNASSPLHVDLAARIAFEYRIRFGRDVIINMISFRLHGHNEMDEPAFTQPTFYDAIRKRVPIAKAFEQYLLSLDPPVLSANEVNEFSKAYHELMESEYTASATGPISQLNECFTGKWSGLRPSTADNTEDLPNASKQKQKDQTGISEKVFSDEIKQSVAVSDNFKLHPRLERHHVSARLQRLTAAFEGKQAIDWATAEAAAFGSLLHEGYNVRISGQDCGRGTFSQRHVMLFDQNTANNIVPLNLERAVDSNSGVANARGNLEVANSPLSEYAVLGFEYGFSLESPRTLVIWEAQYGDFANCAQPAIDTLLACGESKWMRQSGLVVLLPHGYDGTGPEHSCSRVERFLAQSATLPLVNWNVVWPSTAAQYFHILRRQMHRPYRRPTIVVAPKTLLRLPAASCKLSDFTEPSTFAPVLASGDNQDADRVVLCSGKIFYELSAAASSRTAFVRLEELAPFPLTQLEHVLTKVYSRASELVWCQEEPRNMGAWHFAADQMNKSPVILARMKKMRCASVARHTAASPATGVTSQHLAEQAKLIETAVSPDLVFDEKSSWTEINF